MKLVIVPRPATTPPEVRVTADPTFSASLAVRIPILVPPASIVTPAPIVISFLLPSRTIEPVPTVRIPVTLALPLTHSEVPAAPTGPTSNWKRGLVVPIPTFRAVVWIPELVCWLLKNPVPDPPPPPPMPMPPPPPPAGAKSTHAFAAS